jgi:hypothetical protein
MQLGGAIAQALGLKSTRHIVIDIPLEGAVTVTATYLPTKEEVAPLPEILAQYRLFPHTREDVTSEVDRLRDAAQVFAEYGVSVQPQLVEALRRCRMENN